VRAQEAGAVAVLFSKQQFRDGQPSSRISIPGVSLPKAAAEAIKGALAAGEKVEVELVTKPGTWGFLRFWDIQDKTMPVQAGTFATPATDQIPASRPGAFSVHNPFVRGDRLYATWYSDGVRVLDISDPAHPHELGHFVPPFEPGTKPVQGFGRWPMVWGAVEHNGLVLVNDMATGLWVLRDIPR
jgi:hypothetical protein